MIDALMPVDGLGAATRAAAGTGSLTQMPFADWLWSRVDDTSQNIQAAERATQQLMLGEADNLHEVMFAIQKASLSLELVVQVRDRLLEAYQDIARMQV